MAGRNGIDDGPKDARVTATVDRGNGPAGESTLHDLTQDGARVAVTWDDLPGTSLVRSNSCDPDPLQPVRTGRAQRFHAEERRPRGDDTGRDIASGPWGGGVRRHRDTAVT